MSYTVMLLDHVARLRGRCNGQGADSYCSGSAFTLKGSTDGDGENLWASRAKHRLSNF